MLIKKIIIELCINVIKGILWILDKDHRTRECIGTDNTKKFTHVQSQHFKSDYGKVSTAFRTVPYAAWELNTTKHTLVAADKHRVVLDSGQCVWIQDLQPGDLIKTEDGLDRVTSVKDLGVRTHMYCVEVNTNDPHDPYNHLYHTNGILSHNTATAAAYVLWFSIFNDTVNVLIAANKFRAATEIMDRIRFAYEELPDWLRPGVVTYNVQKIEFDNSSKIESTTTTPDSGRGKSISLLYVDEMAFLKPRVAEDFWTAISPTLATGGKCIITSTPNSDEDTFAQIWYGANNITDDYGNEIPGGLGRNGFKSFRATWEQHPDRDEEWAQKERAKLGAEKFAREYELQFITADSTLIDGKMLALLTSEEPAFKTGEIRWWERPQPGAIYCVSLDPSAGVGEDYSAIQVWRLPDMVQVAEWMHNRSSVGQQLKTMVQICQFLDRELRRANQYAEPEIFWTFENNSYGQAVIELLNEIGVDMVPGQLMNEPGQPAGKFRRGLNTNGRTKSQSVTKLKSLVETQKLGIRSRPLISQLKNYVTHGGSFGAKGGEHDDLVSATLLIVRMSQMIAKWDDRTAVTVRDDTLADFEDLLEPMPISMSTW